MCILLPMIIVARELKRAAGFSGCIQRLALPAYLIYLIGQKPAFPYNLSEKDLYYLLQ